jgi:50S ribosomal protein L16 3-hydroxylase
MIVLQEASKQACDWDGFVRDHWQREPVVLTQAFEGSPLSGDAFFALLANAADDLRVGSRDVAMTLMADGGLRLADYSHLLPRHADADLDGYGRRLKASFGAVPWTLTLYSAQYYDRHLFRAARRFLHGLFDRVGIPRGAVDLDVFVGEYRSTPTGVHRDAASNFSIVVEGVKEYLFWPKSALSTPLQPRRGHVALGTSSCATAQPPMRLSGQPGDVIYWPADMWHVAVSESNDRTATVNIALYLEENGSASLPRIAASRHRPSDDMIGGPGVAQIGAISANLCEGRLPDALNAELVDFQASIHDASFEREMVSRWQRKVSALGFEVLPPLLDAEPVTERDIVRVAEGSPLVAMAAGDTVVLSTSGHQVCIEGHASARALAHAVGDGEPHRVADLLGAYADGEDGDWVLDVLTLLVRTHSAQVVGRIDS